MEVISDKDLIARARKALQPRRLSPSAECGGVGSALVTIKGNVYTGVCIDTASGIGFCAERAAISAMVTNGESHILTIVAVDWDETIISPCGTCREFIWCMHVENKDTRVLLKDDRVVRLSDLLPEHWQSDKRVSIN